MSLTFVFFLFFVICSISGCYLGFLSILELYKREIPDILYGIERSLSLVSMIGIVYMAVYFLGGVK